MNYLTSKNIMQQLCGFIPLVDISYVLYNPPFKNVICHLKNGKEIALPSDNTGPREFNNRSKVFKILYYKYLNNDKQDTSEASEMNDILVVFENFVCLLSELNSEEMNEIADKHIKVQANRDDLHCYR